MQVWNVLRAARWKYSTQKSQKVAIWAPCHISYIYIFATKVLSVASSRSFWQWRTVQLWPGDIFNCVSCFLVKKHAAFEWKDAISGFPVSPGSAEALVRWGGKIKYIFIAHFLGNIYANNCRNRTVYVKIIASYKGVTFLRHSVRIKLFIILALSGLKWWDNRSFCIEHCHIAMQHGVFFE